MSALVVRPIGPDEVDLFTSFTDASPLGLKPPLAMYLDGLRQWYRPEWSWVALRDGQVVARVLGERPDGLGRITDLLRRPPTPPPGPAARSTQDCGRSAT